MRINNTAKEGLRVLVRGDFAGNGEVGEREFVSNSQGRIRFAGAEGSRFTLRPPTQVFEGETLYPRQEIVEIDMPSRDLFITASTIVLTYRPRVCIFTRSKTGQNLANVRLAFSPKLRGVGNPKTNKRGSYCTPPQQTTGVITITPSLSGYNFKSQTVGLDENTPMRMIGFIGSTQRPKKAPKRKQN